MHFLPLSFRRAHTASIKLLGPLAAKFGLTPARFTLLFCALKLRGTAYQAVLARKLGLSKTTVCKMLGALEKKGLVVRLDRNVFDRRYRRWNVTERGRDALRGLMKVVARGIVDGEIFSRVRWPRAQAQAVWVTIVDAANATNVISKSFDDALPGGYYPFGLEALRTEQLAGRCARGTPRRVRASVLNDVLCGDPEPIAAT